RRETEKWPDRLVTQGDADGGNALFDLVLAFLLGYFRQILMRPGVASNGVARSGHLLHDFWVPPGMLADGEKHRLRALVRQRLEHRRSVTGPRSVVESQHDFVVGQEVIGLEMLKAKTRPARRIDLDHAGNAKRVGIVTFYRCRKGRRCRRSGCSRSGRRSILGPSGRDC